MDSWPVQSEFADAMSNECRLCLLAIELYEAGMDANEEVTKTIAKRVCFNHEKNSQFLLQKVTGLNLIIYIYCNMLVL